MTEFEQFQAGIRAGERVCAESDLYFRTNRWAIDGRGVNPRWVDDSALHDSRNPNVRFRR